VAIYHLNYKSGSRAGGQSGEAKLAYLTRSGKYEAGVDQVLYVEHAHYPTYASSAEEFWKGADEHERVNGRLFVEVEVALPRELDLEQQKELAREMADWLSYKTPTREQDPASPGPLPYTIALHRGHKDENPHAHILLNERPTDGVQRTMEATFKRVNAAHPERGGAPKSLTYHRPEVVKEIRQEWEIRANIALERAGHEARIDHRSYKEQGIEQEPGVHLGHRASAMERAGVQTERGDEQRAIEERNRERERERVREREAEEERAKQLERERELERERAEEQRRAREREEERARERADFERQVKERHEKMSREGFKESTALDGIYKGTLKIGENRAVLVVDEKTKSYAVVADQIRLYQVSVQQEPDGGGKLTRSAHKLSYMEKGDPMEVRPSREGGIELYVGLASGLKLQESMNKARDAEQERERIRQQEQERERQRVVSEAIRQEVERQRAMLKTISLMEKGELDGQVVKVVELHGHRVISINNEYTKSYAVVVDAKEQVARMQLNPETNKPEVVREPLGRELERGERVYYEAKNQSLCSNFMEAHNERSKVEREQKRERDKDKDRGWER
jgi:hypothetical protein